MFGDAAVAAAQIGCNKILAVHMLNVFFFFFFLLLLFLICLTKTQGVEPQHKKIIHESTIEMHEIAKVMRKKDEEDKEEEGSNKNSDDAQSCLLLRSLRRFLFGPFVLTEPPSLLLILGFFIDIYVG